MNMTDRIVFASLQVGVGNIAAGAAQSLTWNGGADTSYRVPKGYVLVIYNIFSTIPIGSFFWLDFIFENKTVQTAAPGLGGATPLMPPMIVSEGRTITVELRNRTAAASGANSAVSVYALLVPRDDIAQFTVPPSAPPFIPPAL